MCSGCRNGHGVFSQSIGSAGGHWQNVSSVAWQYLQHKGFLNLKAQRSTSPCSAGMHGKPKLMTAPARLSLLAFWKNQNRNCSPVQYGVPPDIQPCGKIQPCKLQIPSTLSKNPRWTEECVGDNGHMRGDHFDQEVSNSPAWFMPISKTPIPQFQRHPCQLTVAPPQ